MRLTFLGKDTQAADLVMGKPSPVPPAAAR